MADKESATRGSSRRKPTPPKKTPKQKPPKEMTPEEMKARQDAIHEQMSRLNTNPQMTITEVHDPAGNLIQKETTISPRQASSVELTMDSKGNIKPSVKVYHEDANTAHELAVKLMTEIYNELQDLTGEK